MLTVTEGDSSPPDASATVTLSRIRSCGPFRMYTHAIISAVNQSAFPVNVSCHIYAVTDPVDAPSGWQVEERPHRVTLAIEQTAVLGRWTGLGAQPRGRARQGADGGQPPQARSVSGTTLTGRLLRLPRRARLHAGALELDRRRPAPFEQPGPPPRMRAVIGARRPSSSARSMRSARRCSSSCASQWSQPGSNR